jgi:hypothetical protein
MLLATGDIRHRLTKGEIREEEIRTAFRPFIPRRFELSTGEIVNVLGGVSGQQDVIVSDASNTAPFVAAGGIGVHPIESVMATLQVKSSISVSTMKKAVENLASVKQLMPPGPRPYLHGYEGKVTAGNTSLMPFCGIVALQADGDADAVVRAFLAECGGLSTPSLRTDALLVVDEFVTQWAILPEDAQKADRIEIGPVQPDIANSLLLHPLGQDSILLFYVLLTAWLAQYPLPTLDLAAYFNAAEIDTRGATRYRWGQRNEDSAGDEP